jgi:hypothetical protein
LMNDLRVLRELRALRDLTLPMTKTGLTVRTRLQS